MIGMNDTGYIGKESVFRFYRQLKRSFFHYSFIKKLPNFTLDSPSYILFSLIHSLILFKIVSIALISDILGKEASNTSLGALTSADFF